MKSDIITQDGKRIRWSGLFLVWQVWNSERWVWEDLDPQPAPPTAVEDVDAAHAEAIWANDLRLPVARDPEGEAADHEAGRVEDDRLKQAD